MAKIYNRAIKTTSTQLLAPFKSPLRPVISSSKKLLTIFGTRPEVIKLAPIIEQLLTCSDSFKTVNITSSQHTDLLYPIIRLFNLRIDEDLKVMQHGQTLSQTCSRVLSRLDPILAREKPDLILVQGDTTTAMAGALAGFHFQIPVAHIEAGLRSGSPDSPYPEEMNRTLISRLATYHFAPTLRNRETLLSEGVMPQKIFVTGNPVVDSLQAILKRATLRPEIAKLLHATKEYKRIVLTTHRRESFGPVMAENLRVQRDFVENHEDVSLIFPVHPNPIVIEQAKSLLSGHPRIHLIEPLNYEDFIMLLKHVWLIVSDSGGIQEEAPSLGKPLLILRDNTERPEVIDAGVARLVGSGPGRLKGMLEEAYQVGSWAEHVKKIRNPFGEGDSSKRITSIIGRLLGVAVVNVKS